MMTTRETINQRHPTTKYRGVPDLQYDRNFETVPLYDTEAQGDSPATNITTTKMGSSDATTQLSIIKWILIAGFAITIVLFIIIAVIVVPQVSILMSEATILARSAHSLVSDDRISKMIGRADSISSDVAVGMENAKTASSAFMSAGLLEDLDTLQTVMDMVRKGVAVANVVTADFDPIELMALLQREQFMAKSLFLVTFIESVVRQNQALLGANLTDTFELVRTIIENLKGTLVHMQQDGITVKL